MKETASAEVKDDSSYRRLEDLIIRNENSLPGNIVQRTREDLKKQQIFGAARAESDSIKIERIFGQESSGVVEKIHNFVLDYFKSMGFLGVKLLPVYIVNAAGSIANKDNYIQGTKKPTHIELYNKIILDQRVEPSSRFFLALMFIAHELYHSSAIHTIDLGLKPKTWLQKIGLPQTRTVQSQHDGASYNVEGDERSPLLEEGLATDFEYKAEEFVRELCKESGLESSLKYDKFGFLDITMPDGSKPNHDADYMMSRLVVQLLRKRINNFDYLVEDMRLNRKTLPFARAVEEQFGTGAFKLITTSKAEDAPAVFEYLSERLKPRD